MLLFQKLTKVRVVGVTCAASEFPCLDKFNFSVSYKSTMNRVLLHQTVWCQNVKKEMQGMRSYFSDKLLTIILEIVQVVLLDESSQMTEPVSLLPMAKFQCEKLVLVGDPKVSNAVLQTQQ